MRVGLGAAGVDDGVLCCAGVAGGKPEFGTLSEEVAVVGMRLLEATGSGMKLGSAIVWLMCDAWVS